MSELPIDRILCGDAVELSREKLPDCSVHAIVTDPPYGLEFMGEEWDKFGGDLKKQASAKFISIGRGTQMEGCGFDKKAKPSFYNISKGEMLNYQKWTTAWAKEALRVLKHGASMLVMGGTRTYHRMTCGAEDAGFIIKDCLAWCYNSGFPKAQDLGKMIDKRLGAEREVVGYKKRNPRDKVAHSQKGSLGYHGSTPQGLNPKTSPTTDLAKKWDGWKVGGLKPAYEPILWAVKPPEGSWTDNVLKHGVGAINVDGCRIPYENENDESGVIIKNKSFPSANKKEYDGIHFIGENRNLVANSQGRYPANMIRIDRFHDGYDKFYFVPKASKSEREIGLEDFDAKQVMNFGHKENPGRNAPKKSYPHKNIHPTVKPVRLMEHLIRLVTCEGQIVFDPFAGSGTTCIAARKLLRHYIGFDNNPDYIEIARHRLVAIPRPLEAYGL